MCVVVQPAGEGTYILLSFRWKFIDKVIRRGGQETRKIVKFNKNFNWTKFLVIFALIFPINRSYAHFFINAKLFFLDFFQSKLFINLLMYMLSSEAFPYNFSM